MLRPDAAGEVDVSTGPAQGMAKACACQYHRPLLAISLYLLAVGRCFIKMQPTCCSKAQFGDVREGDAALRRAVCGRVKVRVVARQLAGVAASWRQRGGQRR
jgi:hypothetical protein